MAEIPIPAGYGVPLVDLATGRLPEPTMQVLSEETALQTGTLVVKAQTTVRVNDTNLRADPELAIVVDANTIVTGRAVVFFGTPLNADMRLGISAPAGSSGRFSVTGPAYTSSGPTSEVVARSGPLFAGNYMEVGGNNTDGVATLEFLIEVGGTPGDLAVVWCQDSSQPGDTLVYAHSFLRVIRVS